MKIVIPSHKRFNMIQLYTLALLEKHNIDFDNVYIFVSPESYSEYLKLLPKYPCISIIKGGSTILQQRNRIINHFNNGERIVEMDDDIEDIMNTHKEHPVSSVADLQKLFTDSFQMIGKKGLWGLNSNTNSFFADGKDKFGLYSIINSCCGYINDKSVVLSVKEKEDFERTLIHFEKGHKILKRCGYGIKTKYWTNKGGIQSVYDFEKRKEIQKQSAYQLLSKYPKYCYLRERKNGITDIRFKNHIKVPTLPPIDPE